jgi:hypothetical protein
MLSDGAGAVWLAREPRGDGISLRIDWLDLISFAGELETCMYAGALKNPDGTLRAWRQESDWGDLLREGFFNLAQDTAVLERYMVPTAFARSFRQTPRATAIEARPGRPGRLAPAAPLERAVSQADRRAARRRKLRDSRPALVHESFHQGQHRLGLDLHHAGRVAELRPLAARSTHHVRRARKRPFTFAYMQLTVV